MEKTHKNAKIDVKQQFENYFSETSRACHHNNGEREKSEEKSGKNTPGGQSLKTLLKSAQEKRKKKDKIDQKKEELADGAGLESVHVQKVYDQIAPHIQDLKQKTWPRVKDFLKSLKAGSLVADVGCGSGRYLHVNPSIFKIGSDICQPFLQTASSRGFEVLTADNLLLPYRENMLDAVISIGVIHHFASKERRVQALQELVRILRPGGLMMVYVWAFEQKYRKFDSQDILVPWHKPRKTDSGHGWSRVSSLSDMDRLSTSSTGSSLSDDDLTCCSYHPQNHITSSCKVHCLASMESKNAGHTSRCIKHNKETFCQESSFDTKNSHQDNCFSGDALKFPLLSQQLTKGEALIRECQRIESYLSSLCKNPLGFLSEKSKPSKSNSLNQSSVGSAEEYVFASTEKSSSFQSLSLADDDVFVDKVDSPERDSPSKTDFVRPPQKEEQSIEGTFNSFACRDSQIFDSHQINGGGLSSDSAYSSSCRMSNCSCDISTCNEKDNFWDKGHPQNNREAAHVCKTDIRGLWKSCHQERGETREKLFSAGDTHYTADKELEQSFSNDTASMEHGHKEHNSPRNVFAIIKQGFKNIFGKSKLENGIQASQCFLPCHSAFPQEHFQVREFPQSSLPSDRVMENNTQFASECTLNAESTGSHFTLTHGANEVKNDTLQDGDLNYHCLPYRNTLKEQSVRSNGDASVQKNVGAESTKSSDISPTDCEHRAFRRRKISCKVFHNCASSKSKISSSSAPLQINDAMINADLCRFYHVFREGELEDLISQYVPDVKVIDCFYDHANWCLVLEKL